MSDKPNYAARCSRAGCHHTLGMHVASGCYVGRCLCKAFLA